MCDIDECPICFEFMKSDDFYEMPCCKQVCHLSCIHEFIEYRNGYFRECMFCRSHHRYNDDEEVNKIICIILSIVLIFSSAMLYFYIVSFQ
jgi:hypothetical protein